MWRSMRTARPTGAGHAGTGDGRRGGPLGPPDRRVEQPRDPIGVILTPLVRMVGPAAQVVDEALAGDVHPGVGGDPPADVGEIGGCPVQRVRQFVKSVAFNMERAPE